MKAVILHEYGGPDKLKLEEVDDPKPGAGEVLVRVAAASINPVDWKMRSGAAKERFPVQFPGILGRDLSGIVRAVGDKVTDFVPGDKVMALAHHTYAELVVVKASELVKVPDAMKLIDASALPLVLLTGEQLISRAAKVQPGQTVLVTGAVGSVGRAAVWTAKKLGARVIAGVRRKQIQQAKELGADEILAIDDDKELDKLGFVDAVADTVDGETAQKLISKVKQGGIFGSVVGPPANAGMHPTVTVNTMTAVPDPPKLRELAEDIVAGKFSIPVDRMLPLSDAGQGQAAAEKGGIGKVLLVA